MNEQELKSMVEMAFRVADTCDLGDLSKGMLISDEERPGEHKWRQIRFVVFNQLLAHILPQNITQTGSMELREAKEGWQE